MLMKKKTCIPQTIVLLYPEPIGIFNIINALNPNKACRYDFSFFLRSGNEVLAPISFTYRTLLMLLNMEFFTKF